MLAKKKLTSQQIEKLLAVLKERFENNIDRHPTIKWHTVYEKLCANPEKIWSLNEMEITGGEPDLISIDSKENELCFFDCSAESPRWKKKYLLRFRRTRIKKRTSAYQ